MWSSLRALTSLNPSVRTRRAATSTFFITTFAASILTVSLSASTMLPCPANKRARATLADEDVSNTDDPMPIGHKVRLTRKGGWIEIEHPLKKSHPPSSPN
ncbi:uncharacterized protein UMAG_05944 [Mycosarcoma maydis]|uniref:Uncharacterized protein n=1 Tax=Mycosarcoma maydis TaxID=5270 RepID=A0A0D1DUF0_MYCMD|nr:uncharacterized protein UMAG_05944 [Ustilago maydis 521]KIS66210.1 hypothetical protein UMAG_05944 [Ustilago maydis 521]|eukprot:XP_011392277.1 hypothetical protein UMAG_05944 [Ustilago maydis 521]